MLLLFTRRRRRRLFAAAAAALPTPVSLVATAVRARGLHLHEPGHVGAVARRERGPHGHGGLAEHVRLRAQALDLAAVGEQAVVVVGDSGGGGGGGVGATVGAVCARHCSPLPLPLPLPVPLPTNRRLWRRRRVAPQRGAQQLHRHHARRPRVHLRVVPPRAKQQLRRPPRDGAHLVPRAALPPPDAAAVVPRVARPVVVVLAVCGADGVAANGVTAASAPPAAAARRRRRRHRRHRRRRRHERCGAGLDVRVHGPLMRAAAGEAQVRERHLGRGGGGGVRGWRGSGGVPLGSAAGGRRQGWRPAHRQQHVAGLDVVVQQPRVVQGAQRLQQRAHNLARARQRHARAAVARRRLQHGVQVARGERQHHVDAALVAEGVQRLRDAHRDGGGGGGRRLPHLGRRDQLGERVVQQPLARVAAAKALQRARGARAQVDGAEHLREGAVRQQRPPREPPRGRLHAFGARAWVAAWGCAVGNRELLGGVEPFRAVAVPVP